jgi:hypothetical protein
MHNRRNSILPQIPRPEPKEKPVVEQLVHPEASPTTHARQKMVKPFEVTPEAKFNRLYGSLRTEGGWEHVVDNYAKGGITTVAAATVTANVTLALTNPETRLLRWPGAVQLYLCIRSFALGLSTATLATLGSLDVYYQDLIGGQIIPLGSIQSNDEINLQNVNILIPTPVTDAGALANPIGQLQVALSSGATVGTYVWQMGFSYAYLLPAIKGYEIQHIQELMDGHYGPVEPHRHHGG